MYYSATKEQMELSDYFTTVQLFFDDNNGFGEERQVEEMYSVRSRHSHIALELFTDTLKGHKSAQFLKAKSVPIMRLSSSYVLL